MSTEEPRDHDIDALLRTTLRAQANDVGEGRGESVHGAGCLDAETLAEWTEGTLSRADARAVDAHVADCAHCQAVLAAFVRTEAPDAPPPVPLEAPAGASLWQRWRLGWLVPIAASATALAVWVATPALRQDPPIEPVSVPATATSAAPVGAATETTAAPSVADQPALPEATRLEARLPRSAPKGAQPDASLPAAGVMPEATLERIPREAAGKEHAPAESLAGAASVEDLGVRANDARLGGDARQEVDNLRERRDVAAGARAPASREVGRSLDSFSSVTTLLVRAPGDEYHWRVSAGPGIEYSRTGGRSWTAASAPANAAAAVIAGVAPGGQVCWLVGRQGLVLQATSGETFSRLSFPLAVDLTTIRAEDGRRATVGTADGRLFSTADGGVTWVVQR